MSLPFPRRLLWPRLAAASWPLSVLPWEAWAPSPGARLRRRRRYMAKRRTRRHSAKLRRRHCTVRNRKAKTDSRSNSPNAASPTLSPSQPNGRKTTRGERLMASTLNLPPRTNAGLPRVDGPLKVSGVAMYTSDHNLPGMLYAVPVCATIANGTVTAIDTSGAQKMPGVKAVYTRQNLGKLFRSAPSPDGLSGYLDEARPPFDDDIIRYYGQYVAAVVALTYEQAVAAANAVKVTYKTEKPDVRVHLETDDKLTVDSHRGNPDEAF